MRTVPDTPVEQEFLESLFQVLTMQLKQVEHRITTDGTVDAVALGNIAKTYEKLIELRGADQSSPKNQTESGAVKALREMLAGHLERVNEQG